MPLQLPNGVLKPSVFDPGDSLIKSTGRLAAYFEAFEFLNEATKSYNLKNTSVPVPSSTSSYDDNENTATFGVGIPYKRVGETEEARDYISEETNWVVPTSGELAGLKSLSDALIYMAKKLTYFAGELRANVIINSAKGLVVLEDSSTESQFELSSTLPYNTIRDAATGAIGKRAQNWLLLLDEQEGL